ncbi:MAG: disulfide oxidoreductase [Deltaproteobacteria bacterium]|nr:disulfide oxidoreductase [Deltaproteobacteria bacterium]
MTKDGPIVPDMVVGDVLKVYPAAREKVRELFGAECLRCRSNRRETITYTSWHRGLDPKEVCRALNAALKGKG